MVIWTMIVMMSRADHLRRDKVKEGVDGDVDDGKGVERGISPLVHVVSGV